MAVLDLERGSGGLSASGCGAGTQILTGAFVGALVGYGLAIIFGRDERLCTAAGALVGAILLPLIGC